MLNSVFSNNLNTTGAITGQNIYSNSAIDAPNIYASNSFIGNNWSSYTLPYIYINSPVNNLTLYSDLKLNGNRITDSNGLHKMSFVGGTLEVSSGITTGRYYSYGWLNSSGGTGAASVDFATTGLFVFLFLLLLRCGRRGPKALK